MSQEVGGRMYPILAYEMVGKHLEEAPRPFK